MKRFLSVMLVCALPLYAIADFIDKTGYLRYSFVSGSTDKVMVYGTNSSVTRVDIPSTVTYEYTEYDKEDEEYKTKRRTCQVVGIGSIAFRWYYDLVSVEIPDSVKKIEGGAFLQCSSLSEISLKSVETIEGNAFSLCSSLETIDLPSTLRAMGDKAFYGCTSLTRFETPSSLKSLGNHVLDGCTALEHATINGDGTLHLGTSMFHGCTSLVSVVLGEGIVSIADGYDAGVFTTAYIGMFSGCSNLKTVDIRTKKLKKLPDHMFYRSSVETVKFAGGVEYVGYCAFNGCSSLNAIEGEFSPEIVTNSAFYGCTSLVDPVDLSRCTYLGNSAFSGCASLIGPVDLSRCTYLGNSAFYKCASLSGSVCLDKLSTVPSSAFYGCSSLSGVSFNSVETIGESAFYGCSSLEAIDLPSTLRAMGNYAFQDCKLLQELNIANGVTNIGDRAFYGCTSLTRFETPSSLKSLGNGVLYGCTALEHATINGDGTLHLGTTMFYGCTSLVSVVLGEGIASIADGYSYSGMWTTYYYGMFSNCSNLKTVDIRTTKLKKLPDYMFRDSSVETVRLAGGVEYVGYCAFYYCDSLKSIEGEFSPEIVTNSAFSGCASLIGSVDLSQCTYLGNSAFYGCKSLVGPVDLNKLSTIPSAAFSGCSSLSGVSLNSVETIKDNAFYGCSSLEAIDLPSTLRAMGDYAFYDCKLLQELNIANGVTNIGDRAFYGCTSLTRFETPSSLKSLGNGVLHGCTALEHATINGDGTLHLGTMTFYGCTSLESVVLGEGIASIADGYTGQYSSPGMFSNCSNLKTVDIRTKKLQKLPDYMFYKSSVETVKFAGGVEYVGYSAFNGCSSLNAIEGEFSPEIVTNSAFYKCASLIGPVDLSRCTYLGNSAFYGCKSLVGPVNLNKLSMIPSSAFNGCSSLSGVSLNSVETIKDKAFYGCSSLEAIDLPSTLRAMGNYAFQECKLLQELNIANGVTNIGNNAFCGCTSLTRFETPSSLKSLGNGVLYGCTALEHATINGDGTLHLGTSMFRGCTSLVSVVLGEGIASIADGSSSSGMFSNCNNLKTVDVRTEKLQKLPAYMFYKSSVETLSFAGVITNIGQYALSGCSGLERINATIKPVSIGNSAFSGCASLIGPVDLSRCTYLGNSAFYGCKSLVGPVDLNKLNTIPSRAFYGCSSLSGVSLKGVANIESSAFQECTSLAEISLQGTESVQNQSFYGCSSLLKITNIDSLTNIGGRAFAYCTSLANAFFEWIPPITVASDAFYNINTNCYGFYLDKYETEWDAVIDENGKWHGLIMRHMENDQCCQVRFDPNGGNISAADATKTVIKNSTIGKLPTATMDGHMLEGWYTLPTGGVRVTESTLVVDDMTCYANWFQSTNTVPPEEDEKWSYTVRFHPNGDKEPFYPVIGTVPDQQFYFDEEKALNLNCYSRTGFKFGGWVKNPNKKYVNDYPDGKVVKNIAQKDGDVVDLYALWIPSTVKITFDYNFSLNDFGIIERYYTVGRKFGRLPFFAGSTRAKWLGWFTDPVGGAEVDMAETWVPTSPTTYYGHWWIYDRPLPEPPPVEEPPEGYYIVLFDANGGSINPVDQAIIVASGEPIGEFPAVTRDGYDFDGWYTAANGGMRIAESTLVTANMTCYAHWRELPVAPVPDPGYGYIRNVTAKQRYPWNGKVDIRFEVVGDVTAIKPGAVPVLAVSATNTVSGETWDAESLTGDTGTEEGWHEILWDLDAQGLDIYSSDIVITVGYRGNVQTNGSSSGKYCVIDLSGGANATNYPVSYLDSEPTGGWTDEYKTAKLVLRRIDPGTFMMGDISASKAVEVALTKPFYMGVFEVTQKQYGLVTGQNPSSIKGNGMPVDRVSWQAIRGNNNWPDVKTVTASSFVGLIQTKTGLKFDLPTEAQWEYACRAGTATSYYWGDSMDGDYAWYWDNSTNLIHEAGTKRPNAWGLYDMIGNVNEWCLDWYQDKLPGGENPEGYTSGRGRAVRGGNGTNFAYTCTSSYRSFSSPMPALGYYGFRLSRTLSDSEIADASTIPGGAQEEGESSGLLCTGASPRTPIDMRDEPEVESARIVHDSRWIGGDPGAAVLVTDNDEEVRWVAGKGEFTWVPATAGRHVLKYLTYIDGVLQEEIYTAIFRCGNPPEDDPVVGVVSSRVTSVSVKPRWPWNGLVDIDYTLAVEPAEGRTAISVSGYDTVTKTVLAPVTLSGVGADGEPVPSGTHRITWDVGADYPEFHSEAFTVDVSTGTPGAPTEIANVSTAAGTNCVSVNGQYMVIDLSGGTNAVSYPVSWLDAVPTGGMTSNYVRVDVRSGIGRYLASGVELLGRPDGAYVSEWDTRGETDGWRPVVSDNAESPSVCVLNTTAIVHGGRIGSDETWRSDHVHVVRSNIVVPDGVRLVLDMDAIVKFAPGAKIATEGTGVLLVNGARCADIADDSVGGDTNMDMDGADGGLSPSTTVADWFEGNVRPFSVRFGSIGDVIEDCVLKRFYTSGIPLGTLPVPKVPGNKVFDCWCVEDSGTPVDGNCEVVSSMVLLPRYSASYYWLEISATEGGSTSRSSGLVEAETRIVVIAEPAFGFRFVRWEGDVSESQAYSSQIAVLMDRARSLRAVFERIPITIGEAVNAPQLSWYTEGDAEWFGEWSRMASDGEHAARSGGIGDSKETVLGLRVSGTGVLSFDWKSSCEERYDAVRLEIDGTQTRVLSGESSWASVRIELGFGDHDIRWVYKKGRSNSSGEDAVWVDNVAWTAAATPTLRDALGDFDWESEGEIKWRAMRSEYAYEGDSFAIAEGLGDYGASVIRTTVSGAGRIMFRWAVSCEEGYDWFDFLADGEVVEMTTGETGWKTVSVDLGEGEHELEWVYWKDEIDDPELVGANCAMLDYVQWFPAGEEPPTIGGETLDAFFEWLKSNEQIVPAATRQEAMDLFFAGTAAAGKNIALYDEFLAGTDPKDPASCFKAIIDIKDGKPVVSPSPDLGDARRYTIYGKKDIGDASEPWIRVEEGGESQFRFFKVTVDMP